MLYQYLWQLYDLLISLEVLLKTAMVYPDTFTGKTLPVIDLLSRIQPNSNSRFEYKQFRWSRIQLTFFAGFQVNGSETWTEFHKNEYKPKPFGDYDVDIKIQACGICGSDVHTISGGWGDQKFPLCVGHGTLLVFSFAVHSYLYFIGRDSDS